MEAVAFVLWAWFVFYVVKWLFEDDKKPEAQESEDE